MRVIQKLRGFYLKISFNYLRCRKKDILTFKSKNEQHKKGENKSRIHLFSLKEQLPESNM